MVVAPPNFVVLLLWTSISLAFFNVVFSFHATAGSSSTTSTSLLVALSCPSRSSGTSHPSASSLNPSPSLSVISQWSTSIDVAKISETHKRQRPYCKWSVLAAAASQDENREYETSDGGGGDSDRAVGYEDERSLSSSSTSSSTKIEDFKIFQNNKTTIRQLIRRIQVAERQKDGKQVMALLREAKGVAFASSKPSTSTSTTSSRKEGSSSSSSSSTTFTTRRASVNTNNNRREIDDDYVKSLLHEVFEQGIQSLHSLGMWWGVIDVHNFMSRCGLRPGPYYCSYIMNACAKTGQGGKALGVLGFMKKEGMTTDLYIYGFAITACAKGGRPKDARLLLYELKEEGLKPNEIIYNSAVGACETPAEALQLIEEMKREGLSPNVFVYSSAVAVCAKKADWQMAKEILKDMRKLGINPNVFSYSAAIAACAHAANVKQAMALLADMREEGMTPNEVSYGNAVGACLRAGDERNALALLREMKENGVKAGGAALTAAMKAAGDGEVPTGGEITKRSARYPAQKRRQLDSLWERMPEVMSMLGAPKKGVKGDEKDDVSETSGQRQHEAHERKLYEKKQMSPYPPLTSASSSTSSSTSSATSSAASKMMHSTSSRDNSEAPPLKLEQGGEEEEEEESVRRASTVISGAGADIDDSSDYGSIAPRSKAVWAEERPDISGADLQEVTQVKPGVRSVGVGVGAGLPAGRRREEAVNHNSDDGTGNRLETGTGTTSAGTTSSDDAAITKSSYAGVSVDDVSVAAGSPDTTRNENDETAPSKAQDVVVVTRSVPAHILEMQARREANQRKSSGGGGRYRRNTSGSGGGASGLSSHYNRDTAVKGGGDDVIDPLERLAGEYMARQLHTKLRGAAKGQKWQEALNLYRSLLELPFIRPGKVDYGIAASAAAYLGDIPAALSIVDKAVRADVGADEVIMFNSVMSPLAKKGEVDEVLHLLSIMKKKGLKGDAFTYSTIMNVCLRAQQPEKAWQIWKETPAAAVDAFLYSLAMEAASRSGNNADVLKLFEDMRSTGHTMTTYVFNLAIKAAMHRKDLAKVLWLLRDIKLHSVAPNERTFNHAINAAAEVGDINEARNLLEMMKGTEGVVPDAVSYGGVLKACAHAGAVRSAMHILSEAELAGYVSTVLFNSAIASCAKDGNVDMALELKERMKKADVPLDEYTYGSIISASIRKGDWQVAVAELKELRAAGLVPSVASYGAVVDCLSRAGQWEMTVVMLALMKSDRLSADMALYETILSACANVGRDDIVVGVWELMKSDVGDKAIPTQKICDMVLRALLALGKTTHAAVLGEEIRAFGLQVATENDTNVT